MTRRSPHMPASRWRLVIAVIALLGAMPRGGLYFHHHAHGAHAHVHLDEADAPRRRSGDPLAALRIFEIAARHFHTHADGVAHSHADEDVAEHDHAETHDHDGGEPLAHADSPVVAVPGPDDSGARRASRQPGDHRLGLIADLADTATHWHASSPWHHLAASMRVVLQPAGAPEPLPVPPHGRPLAGIHAPTHARGPPRSVPV